MQNFHFYDRFHLLRACKGEIRFISDVDTNTRKKVQQDGGIQCLCPYFSTRGFQTTFVSFRDNVVIAKEHIVGMCKREGQAISAFSSRFHALCLLSKELLDLF